MPFNKPAPVLALYFAESALLVSMKNALKAVAPDKELALAVNPYGSAAPRIVSNGSAYQIVVGMHTMSIPVPRRLLPQEHQQEIARRFSTASACWDDWFAHQR